MQQIPYASAIGSLMYSQVCTRPDIAYIVGMLGRYLSNPEKDHWIAAKRVMSTENKRLHAHLSKVRSVRDHWIF